MMKQIPKEVLDAFTMYESPLANSDAGAIAVEPISGGLINYSFKVSSPVKPDYLLQQINKKYLRILNMFRKIILISGSMQNWNFPVYGCHPQSTAG